MPSSSSRSSGPGELCSVFRRAWKSYSLRHSWSPGGFSSCEWAFKKSVPFTDNLWVAGVDLKSWGFSMLLVRLDEDMRWFSSSPVLSPAVCFDGSLLRIPLCSQPGSTHPTTAEWKRGPPGPDPVAVFFLCVCAQVEAGNSLLPTIVHPCLSVLGGPGVLVIGTGKDPEYLGLLP